MTKEAKILVLVFLVIFGGLGYLIVRNNKLATTPISQELLIKDYSHSLTSPSAKVNLVEFGDYQCPACAAANPIIEELMAGYKDNPNVNLVYRHFPLPQHQLAYITAQAAEAAGAQGKFWEMHNLLYSNQDEWLNSKDVMGALVSYAEKINLNIELFRKDIQDNKLKSYVDQDKADGIALGVNSTPTFFLNGSRLPGVRNLAELKSIIDSELAK